MDYVLNAGAGTFGITGYPAELTLKGGANRFLGFGKQLLDGADTEFSFAVVRSWMACDITHQRATQKERVKKPRRKPSRNQTIEKLKKKYKGVLSDDADWLAFAKMDELRHAVIHEGLVPTKQQAEEAFQIAKLVVAGLEK